MTHHWRDEDNGRRFKHLESGGEGCEPAPWYRMTYEHCGQTWHSEWDCACNDECPECGAEIQPSDVEDA